MIKRSRKANFSKGDFVVYPSYGLGKINGIQNTETFVELERTEKSPVYLSS